MKEQRYKENIEFSKSENSTGTCIIERIVIERILAIVAAPDKLAEIGKSFPLLVEVVMQCGDNDCCTINYHNTAIKYDVSHGTVKGWGEMLHKKGYITKRPAGVHGVDLFLNTDKVDQMQIFAPMLAELDDAQELMRAVVSTVANSLGSVMDKLQTAKGMIK